MASRVPHVFLSSTFYDLRQVRADLAAFVEQDLAYRLIASEFNSFPVDPDVNAVENCRRRVIEDADLLVLVIGSRYGSVPPGAERSVTNIEYLAAKAKDIPIYAFISRDVLALLPVYAANLTANFSGSVDSVRVFDFVEEVRGQRGVWTFPFEYATEIVRALRTQFAYQMGAGLSLAARARVVPRHVLRLTGRSFQLAIEQPLGWEASLFAQVLEDELIDAEDLRRDHEAYVVLGRGEFVRERGMSDWVRSCTDEALRLVSAMEAIAKQAINAGFANSDIPTIIYGARRIGSMYREAYDWALRIRRASIPDRWSRARRLLSLLLDDFTAECRTFVVRAKQQISDALSSDTEETIKLHLTFDFHIGATDALSNEIRRLGDEPPENLDD